ncbi:IS630 family transposase, partial [Ralstonia pseudosolanacearum]
GLTITNFMFRLYETAQSSAQSVGFVKALRAQFKHKSLLVWDSAVRHNSRVVRKYLDSTRGAIQMALLPVYART